MESMSVMHGLVLTILAALAAQAWLNHWFAPRLARMGQSRAQPLISVLIPARNEGPHIGSSVAGWLNQAYQQVEVLVYDDASTDDTARRVAALVPNARLRLMHGDALPTGWRGKPHACHRLRSAARGSILVFADADVTARPTALEKIAAAF